MEIREYAAAVHQEIARALEEIDPESCACLVRRIRRARRVFLAGNGRSGLVVNALAMRLMHLGLVTHVVGEVTTPAIQEGDLLLIGSGSGETQSLLMSARQARTQKADIALVTIHPESSIGECADLTIMIPATTAKSSRSTRAVSIQPKGSLFEQTMYILFDAVVLRLMEEQDVNFEVMFSRHANLE